MNKEVLAEQNITSLNAVGFNSLYLSYLPVFELVEGETYNVVWNNDEFACEAILTTFNGIDGIGLGNFSFVSDAENTAEPFLIGVAVDGSFAAVYTTETAVPITLRIYQQAEASTANEVVLKDKYGVDQTYATNGTIKLKTSDGGTQSFVAGEYDEKTVYLDFAEGDMVVTPDEGKVFKKVSVPKPDTLVPENIVKDVSIAGVVGTSEGGGGATDGSKLHTEPWLEDVCFWDLDGNLVLNIPLSAAQSLEALPTPPEYEGLTFDRWNYTLEQIRTTAYPLDIAPIYTPTDGKTHLKLNVSNTSYLSVTLNFQQTVDSGVSIDWGDGSSAQTVSGTGAVAATHAYAAIGEYEVIISVAEGCTLTLGSGGTNYLANFVIGSNTTASYSGSVPAYVMALYLADGVELCGYDLQSFTYMKHLVLPRTLTKIVGYGMRGVSAPKCLAVPDGVVEIGDFGMNGCGGNSNNRSTHIISLPQSVTTLGANAFSSCYYVARFVIPKNVTSIPKSCCSSMESCRKIYMPDTIESIGMYGLSSFGLLETLDLPNALTSIGDYAFQSDKSLKALKLPSGITSIPKNALYNLYSLQEVVIPASVKTIGDYFLTYAYALRRLVVCGVIESIGSSGILNNYNYNYDVIFLSETPPTYSVFSKLVNSTHYAKVFVPDNAIDAYRAILNSNYNGFILYPLSEYNGELPEVD